MTSTSISSPPPGRMVAAVLPPTEEETAAAEASTACLNPASSVTYQDVKRAYNRIAITNRHATNTDAKKNMTHAMQRMGGGLVLARKENARKEKASPLNTKPDKIKLGNTRKMPRSPRTALSQSQHSHSTVTAQSPQS